MGVLRGAKPCFFRQRPRMCSEEAPFLVFWYPYTSAVSKKLMPEPRAASKICCRAGCTRPDQLAAWQLCTAMTVLHRVWDLSECRCARNNMLGMIRSQTSA